MGASPSCTKPLKVRLQTGVDPQMQKRRSNETACGLALHQRRVCHILPASAHLVVASLPARLYLSRALAHSLGVEREVLLCVWPQELQNDSSSIFVLTQLRQAPLQHIMLISNSPAQMQAGMLSQVHACIVQGIQSGTGGFSLLWKSGEWCVMLTLRTPGQGCQHCRHSSKTSVRPSTL